MDLPVTIPISTPFSLRVVHVEISSKCTLKCPRCPRTELPNLDYLNQEISLECFKKIFSPEMLDQIEFMVFCGHTGDPIYAKDFLEIVEYIKSNSTTSVQIITNGSYKKSSWWKRLGTALGVDDAVVFSVDGWDNQSNNQYRINSNFDSIIKGIKTLRANSGCFIHWSSIYFAFNQHNINQLKQLSKDLGCDTFQLVKSSKFDGDYLVNGVDSLKPTEDLVSQNNNYDKNNIVFTRPNPFTIKETRNKHPWAKCLNGIKEINLTVDGYVYPCAWFNSGYQSNKFFEQHRERLNVFNRSFEQVLSDSVWQELIDNLDTDTLPICKLKCKHG